MLVTSFLSAPLFLAVELRLMYGVRCSQVRKLNCATEPTVEHKVSLPVAASICLFSKLNISPSPTPCDKARL